jgi:hypothetical protein
MKTEQIEETKYYYFQFEIDTHSPELVLIPELDQYLFAVVRKVFCNVN